MPPPLPALPELAVTHPTAEITAKFQVWFQDDAVGELEFTTRAAPILHELTAQVAALTDADLEAIRELSAAAYRERDKRAQRATTDHDHQRF